MKNKTLEPCPSLLTDKNTTDKALVISQLKKIKAKRKQKHVFLLSELPLRDKQVEMVSVDPVEHKEW